MLLLTNNFEQDSEIAVFQMSMSVMVILTKSITKPKKVICCVGMNTDFSGCIVKPNSLKSFTLSLTLLKQVKLELFFLAAGNRLDI